MRSRFIAFVGVIVILTFGLNLNAQTPKLAAKPYTLPRTPDGHPDLQGTYDLATLTPLERPNGMKAVLTDAEARNLERAVATQAEAAARPINADRARCRFGLRR